MSYRHDNDALTVMDWFCGAGGSSQGVHAVPGVRVTRAANHWLRAIESHAANFPDTDHYQGDIRKAPVWDWPVTDIFWASPECTNWSVAKGKRRDFDTAMQGDLFSLLEETEEEPTAEEESRALMEEVPLYLRGVQERGGLVKAGVVENVVDVRQWSEWDRWIGEIRKLGYETKVIALNAMHALPRTVHQAPQSRDRLFVAYWHRSLGRTPDWNKWLRPRAWCASCEQHVDAMQVFKRHDRDMGRYRQQYVYRCPKAACRYAIVEPEALPAATCIDWSIPGQRIGDRTRPLADKTLARIQAGITRFARPLDGRRLQIPPLMVPVEGRDGKEANSALAPLRTQTARNETGLAWLPFIAELRGGGSVARPVTEALATVTASGNHHGLVTPDPRIAIVEGDIDIHDVLFRMLDPHEIGRAMAFADDYIVLGSKRERVRQYGNGVPPGMAEVLVCPLVEAITGSELERHTTPRTALAA
ncbi:DNA cytosine methyltransferase [Streptomyces sp. NBC_00140]|uniref:DNA cytosine methyltransferase n=1 Tax=Streptomyces sp. NBC_00140 TaxID=2975664 RepID=UPI002257F99F|nr:DNA cytosine methyltransferase [Streptomyces sp. NBC_00140]MCX5336931.1 DNA cytosine methyltransferase [Streptomyces sp. NBC_00140]MCX5338414.1 DNA cytosine methyltransferase [Streptomyces sp. NBC_00140]